LRAQRRFDQVVSNISVIATGGLMLLVEVAPKKPATKSPAAVVVTDGATIDRLSGENAPLCESTGASLSMPLTSRIAPAAETDDAQVQV
jgi:hypothetical protein